MRITKEQPPAPPAEYVLRMSYSELHELSRELARFGTYLDGVGTNHGTHLRRLRDLIRREDYQCSLSMADGCDCSE